VDGAAVTKLRTSAASALASTYLSRADSAHLTIFGTGELAPYMAMAHCTARPIRRVSVCGRDVERVNLAVAAIRSLVERHIEISAAASIEEAVSAADIVSCATNSSTPVFAGKWLKPGAFVDLVGSFSPTKREADDDAVCRARIFVDTFEGALAEAGDLIEPLQRGIIGRERIEGELADLVTGRVQGRGAPEEITLFKSVGTALEDLAAAEMIVRGS
jgi:ornithine cyclodeaminase